jgi:hypothetical protein
MSNRETGGSQKALNGTEKYREEKQECFAAEYRDLVL